nr:hypothetical protein [Tanacetum cinerariifolium]
MDGRFVAFGGSPKGGKIKGKGIQIDIHAGQASQEKSAVHEYILLPFIPLNPPLSLTIQSSDVNVGDKPGDIDAGDIPGDVNAGDIQGDVDEISRNYDVCQGNEIRIDSSTHAVNVASPSINTASNIIDAGSLNINIADYNHTNIPTLETTNIFNGAFDDRDLVAEADTNNLDSSTVISREGQIIKIFKTACLLVSCSKRNPRRFTLWKKSYWLKMGFQKQVGRKRLHSLSDGCEECILYGKIEEEVYVCQPPGFEDLDFLDKVYKVKKALYGLHQAPRACQDKYVADILKKFGFSKVKTASTSMETSKPLLKDEDRQEVDVYMYRSKIGSIMYLTSSRPDIMFAVCACAKHQVFGIQKTLPLNWRPTQIVTMQDLVWTGNLQPVDVNSLAVDLYPGSVKSKQWLQTSQLRLSILLLQVVMDCAKTTAWNESSSTMASAIICLADNQKFNSQNFSGIITPLFDTMMVQAPTNIGDTPIETYQTPIVDQPSTSKPQKKQNPRRKQRKEAGVSNDDSEDDDHVPTPFSDPLPNGEDNFILNEIDGFLYQLTRTGRRVKPHMEKDSLGAQEDASKQERMIEEIDQNAEIALDDETQGRTNDEEMFGFDDLAGEEVVMETTTCEHKEQIIEDVSTAEPVTTAGEVVTTTTVKDSAASITYVTKDEITMAQELDALKSIKPKVVGRSFDEIKKLFDKEKRKVNDFTAMDSEAQESSIKRTIEHLEHDISKKQKVDENVKPVIDDSEELKKCIEIVPDDGDDVHIEATPLSSRSPTTIDYEIYKEGKKTYFKIIRADGVTLLRSMSHMVEDFVKRLRSTLGEEGCYDPSCISTEEPYSMITKRGRRLQTILLGLPEDIYAAIDSCETAQKIWLRVQQMMKGSDIPEWSRHVTIVHQTKDLHTADYTQLYDFLKYNQKEVDELKAKRIAKTQDPLALMANSNNPYRISSNLKNKHIAQPSINMGQDRQMQMVRGNGGNQFRQYAGQNAGNQAGYIDVIGNQNQIGNGNLVAARAEGNADGQNGNQIRCYNCRGVGIQLQAEEYDLMANAADLDKIEEVNANCILMANLQQASTSGTQTDNAPFYDTDGSTENDNNVISEDTSVEQGGETIEQHPANFKETPLSREESYFSNNSKMANVSKSFSIPHEDLSDDTTPSVARKFLNEVKSTIVTLQRVVKQRMTIETHNWASSAHQELHKIVRDEIFPIVNQVDARLQNFEIQFLKEAAKFVGDFKSIVNEADASLAKHKALELEIEHLLKAVGKSKDTSSVSDTQNPLSQKLENENVELEFQLLNYARENAHLKATYKDLFDSIYVSRKYLDHQGLLH